MISKWLKFNEAGKSDSGKTKIWSVYSKKGDQLVFLGEVRWYATWRKYAFFPEMMTVFEEECLRDISFFVEQATRRHRQK